MISRHTFVLTLLLILNCYPTLGQSVGDSVAVIGEHLRASPEGEKIGFVEEGEFGKVTDVNHTENYFEIDFGNREGWVFGESVMEARDFRNNYVTEDERENHIEQMRSRGYAAIVHGMAFDKELQMVGIGVHNITENNIIKYARAEWTLYNRVGDPVGGSMVETEVVGPIKPGRVGSKVFYPWEESKGTCAVLNRLKVELMNGKTQVFEDVLPEITRFTNNKRLEGDCSYEAQQRRQ